MSSESDTSGSLVPPIDPIFQPPSPEEEPIPRTIGPYSIERRIGRGGYGMVYLAKRDDPQGRVAIKVIRRDRKDAKDIVRRFHNERHILNAFREHPNIVKLLDSGSTEDDQPYFVMEYVEGKALDEYCDEHRLTVKERLHVFLTVCSAVKFAHIHLIIHRDLKPENILVGSKNDQGKPSVRLLDFGIAKFLNPELSAQTIIDTVPGFGSLGLTPEYASPEQIHGKTISTTSDVYSLGVILYELLSGHPPYTFNGERENVKKVEQVVSGQDPLKPSKSISKTEKAHKSWLPGEITPEYVSHRRRESPWRLRYILARDLDNIVLKAMHKDPQGRYQSVEEFSQDVQDYLAGDPVKARGNPFGYRAAKFIRKHLGKLSAAALVFLAILCLAGWALAERSHANDAAKQANWQRTAAEEASMLAEKRRNEAEDHLYVARMHVARQELDEGNIGRVLGLLGPYLPGTLQAHRRGFEWGYYWRLCHSELRTLVVHPERKPIPVSAVTFADKGKTLVAGGYGRLIAWDRVKDWQPLDLGKPFVFPVIQLVRAPHGETLASGDDRGNIKWRSKDAEWKELTPGITKPGGLTALTFVGDANSLAVVRPDQTTVEFWQLGEVACRLGGFSTQYKSTGVTNLIAQNFGTQAVTPTGAPMGSWLQTIVALGLVRSDPFILHKGIVRAIASSPDGKTIVTGSADKTVIVWAQVDGVCQVQETLAGHDGEVTSLAFSPDGKLLATASADHTVKLWKLRDGKWREASSLRGHAGRIASVTFSPSGKIVATGSDDTTAKLWDADTGRHRATFKGHMAQVRSVAFAPDGKTLATASNDGTVKIWDAEREQTGHQIALKVVLAMALGPGGRILAAGRGDKGKDSTVVQFSRDAGAGQLPITLGEHAGTINCMAFAPGGSILATGSSLERLGIDGVKRTWISEVKVWDTVNEKPLATLPGPTGIVRCLVVAPDGKQFAAGTNEGNVMVWNVSTMTKGPLCTLPLGKTMVLSLAFSPDGKTLVTGGVDGAAMIWDLEARQIRHTLQHGKRVSSIAFAPNGETLATASDNSGARETVKTETVKIWDVATGELLRGPEGMTDPVFCMVFAPDGRTLVTADRELRLWDVSTGQERATLRGLPGPKTAIRFVAFMLPDGRRLAAGCMDGTVIQWDAATDEEVAAQARPLGK